MPLLAELVAFYVIVAIKISLLRSWESHPAESIPEADHVFQSLSCEAWLFWRACFAPEAVPLSPPPIRRFAPFAHSCLL